jgi:NTE family protein
MGMTEGSQVTESQRDFAVVLVLSGGNALGAFEAGVYEALHAHGLQPEWVVGASIGAINAALIAGSQPDARIKTLRSFWQPHVASPMDLAHPWLSSTMETGRRSAAAAWTAAAGRSGIFGPALSALTSLGRGRPSLFETDQLVVTLGRLIDFDLLNRGACRFTATAVDLESGDDVVFDSRDQHIEPRHVRASAALPVLFPPVEIAGRWLVDGGLSANLPIDPVLSDPSTRPTLCIAVDLLPLNGPLPSTLGEAAGRMQDLIFAAQSRRSIERWQAAYALEDNRRISLVRVAYTKQQEEVAGKALDFSGPTIAGVLTGRRLVKELHDGAFAIGEKGLNVFAFE